MQIIHTALLRETVTYEDFRLEFTLLRSDPEDAALCPLYGIACTADRSGMTAGTYRNLSVTENAQAARRLFRLLTENAVFPDHIDDVIHDMRESWSTPVWAAG